MAEAPEVEPIHHSRVVFDFQQPESSGQIVSCQLSEKLLWHVLGCIIFFLISENVFSFFFCILSWNCVDEAIASNRSFLNFSYSDIRPIP